MTTTTPSPATHQSCWDDPSHIEWARFSARLSALIPKIAGRDDLIVTCAPKATAHAGLSEPPAAMFAPWKAHIYLDAAVTLNPSADDPAYLDPRDRRDHVYMPRLMGTLAHEAAHAAHTRLRRGVVDPNVFAWMMVLEEPRIESAMVARHAYTRTWLRRSWSDLIAGAPTLGESTNVETITHNAILTLGRQAGGVLSESEVKPYADMLIDTLGVDYYERLMDLLRQACDCADGDVDALQRAALAVLDLIEQAKLATGQDADTGDEPTDSGQGDADGDSAAGGNQPGAPGGDHGQRGDSGAGEAQPLPCGSYTPGDEPSTTPAPTAPQGVGEDGNVTPSNPDADTQVSLSVQDATTDEDHGDAISASAQRAAADTARRQATDVARSVFGPSGSADTPNRGISITHRPPSAAAQRYARELTSALQQAQYEAPNRTRQRYFQPPGAMRSSELIRRQAQIAHGVTVTARPFTKRARHDVPRPPLRVGISCDVSASMQRWQDALSDIAWAINQALTHGCVTGDVASVTWNSTTQAVIKPSRRYPTVPVATCTGITTDCPRSLVALDGALQLTSTPGARIAIVVTDGGLRENTVEPTRAALKRLSEAGVLTLWVTPYPDARFDDVATNVVCAQPEQMGTELGAAMVALLERERTFR